MSLLDRYVGRIVAGAFGAGTLFFLFLMVVMDLLGNLTRYVNKAAQNGMSGLDLALYLASYYTKLLPVLFTTITPFVTVIACMFSVARLQAASEVVPMLFVGRSTQRILRPMLLCGVLAGLGMAACWQWVVPVVQPSIAQTSTFFSAGSTKVRGIVHESGEGVRQSLHVLQFDPAAETLSDIRMLNEGAQPGDNSLIVAKSATWDRVRRDWRLDLGRESRPSAGGNGVEERPVEWLGRPDLTPTELLKRGRESIEPETQSYTDLMETIELRPNRPDFRYALHHHLAYPLANLILLLLALPLAVNFERGARMSRLLAAIALCGGYVTTDLACQGLGELGYMHPVVMAWTPVILFGSLGIVLFGSTRT